MILIKLINFIKMIETLAEVILTITRETSHMVKNDCENYFFVNFSGTERDFIYNDEIYLTFAALFDGDVSVINNFNGSFLVNFYGKILVIKFIERLESFMILPFKSLKDAIDYL